MSFTLHHADCREVIKSIPDCSIDACVTDPPYALVSIVKRFGSPTAAPVNNAHVRAGRSNDPYARVSHGFMGKTWDTGDVAHDPAMWAEVLRVLKPGGHVIAAAGTRTYHRLGCAIEDAGFEIRDMVSWLYGSGFPKSHDVSKGIDKAAGAEREVIGAGQYANRGRRTDNAVYGEATPSDAEVLTAPATPEAEQWSGWGTALKPACEPWVLARKPLDGTVAANVLKWGVGALNIDGCRIPHNEPIRELKAQKFKGREDRIIRQAIRATDTTELKLEGRWPANVIHDGSDEVLAGFPDARSNSTTAGRAKEREIGDSLPLGGVRSTIAYEDNRGSAARFFYCAKASKSDRSTGNTHPTVKPTDLMRYLCRLVTPPGGLILDPFTGSGSTGKAAMLEGFRFIGAEMEAEYFAIANARIQAALNAPRKPVQAALL